MLIKSLNCTVANINIYKIFHILILIYDTSWFLKWTSNLSGQIWGSHQPEKNTFNSSLFFEAACLFSLGVFFSAFLKLKGLNVGPTWLNRWCRMCVEAPDVTISVTDWCCFHKNMWVREAPRRSDSCWPSWVRCHHLTSQTASRCSGATLLKRFHPAEPETSLACYLTIHGTRCVHCHPVKVLPGVFTPSLGISIKNLIWGVDPVLKWLLMIPESFPKVTHAVGGWGGAAETKARR